MRRSALSPVDQTRMISFDGGIAEPVMRQRPDRYRLLGAAVCSGLAACHYEYICLTDGDDQRKSQVLQSRSSYRGTTI